MIISYNSEVNETYVRLSNNPVDETVKIGEYIIDFDSNGHIVGIEYLSSPIIKINGAEVKIR